ncbi:MAG: efflux RND transporter permease subunit [Gemmatimonadetes bacterium]|nr:efflux RND transporter permease subunit [Gemmatimonadota bacterium]
MILRPGGDGESPPPAASGTPPESEPLQAGGLSGVAIRRPVFTIMMMLALVVLGIFSLRRLPIEEMPDVEFPFVVASVVYPGASPETMEREVTRRLEEAFNTVQGVDRITSYSLEGMSQLFIEFELGVDAGKAAQDIRGKVEVTRSTLPTDIQAPVVQQFDIGSLPTVSLALSSATMGIPELTRFADEVVRRRLESVTGVGNAQLVGGLLREVAIELDARQMQALGISLPEVSGALQRQNMEVPAGRLERGTGEQMVRVMGRIEDPAEFGAVVVAMREGQPVRLSQIARVVDTTEEERSLALVNHERAVSIDVRKVSGANTVQVADDVKQEVDRIREQLPPGVKLELIRDNSVFIRESVRDVFKELMIGALLTVLVVMLFLNDIKATIITSFALPISVISAFILMNALGFTINVLTLMGLSLSIGILIDDAIVVIENIVRHREQGEDHFTAAGRGTREIFLAVMATTGSILAVFVPVAFMRGIVGRFFYEFGMTVAWAVLVSLFVSFTLTPMLSAWWGVNPHEGEGGNRFQRTLELFDVWFDRQAERYRGAITWALAHRKTTLGIAFGSLVLAFALFPFIGGQFFPPSDRSEFTVSFETPEGSSLAYTRSRAELIEQKLRTFPGVEFTYTTIGSGMTAKVNGGEVYVKLVGPRERAYGQFQLMAMARDSLTRLYGVQVGVLEAGGMGGSQRPLQVNISGPDVAELQRLSAEVEKVMRGIPGGVDIDQSLGAPRPEFRVHINRDLAAELGLDIGQIAMAVRPLLAGDAVTRWEDPSGEERDVVLRVAAEARTSRADLANLPIATPQREDNGMAPVVLLGQIARIEEGGAPAQVDRIDLERTSTVGAATLPSLSIAEASKQIRQRTADLAKPPYRIALGGETEMLEQTIGYVLETLLLAVILIFLILASQFESVAQPFAIMLSLPLSLIGVLLALLLTNDTMNMMSMIGGIMLMGLVTKNAILLVDNANEKREQGMDRHTALVEAGRVRLRPSMLTTAAMIFGMLPIALALGEGGGFRAPMARAVIGGLITSTMLTLLVVPVAYTYFDDMGHWFKRRMMSESREQELVSEQHHAGIHHTHAPAATPVAAGQ